VYIWNAQLSYEVASLLKRIKPDLILVLGGPEVSYETAEQAIVREADYVICGEGEVAFRQLCQRVLAKQRPLVKIIQPSLPAIEELILPYHLYTNEDLRQRTVYVEASRGCPFSCEFCLSSLDVRVRTFALENFLAAMDQLWQRGLRHYKFIDRTFNLSNKISQAILEFFLARFESGTFLHFEII